MLSVGDRDRDRHGHLLRPGLLALEAAAEADLLHDVVEGLQGAQGPRQELPGPELGGQAAGPLGLHALHHAHEDGHQGDGDADGGQHVPAQDGQAEDPQGQQEEHADEVDDGEPAVLGRGVAQELGGRDGRAEEGQRVEDDDARDVEEEVAEGHLQRAGDGVSILSQRGQDSYRSPGRRRMENVIRLDDFFFFFFFFNAQSVNSRRSYQADNVK